MAEPCAGAEQTPGMKRRSAAQLDAAASVYAAAPERAATPADEFRAPLEPAAVRSIIAGIMPQSSRHAAARLRKFAKSLSALCCRWFQPRFNSPRGDGMPYIGRDLHDDVILIPRRVQACCALCRTACIEI